MASFVQATTGFNSSGSNSNLFTSNFAAACTAGNTLIVAIFIDSATASITTITDNATAHNTYTKLLGPIVTSTLSVWLYAAQNITANAGAVYQVQVTEGVGTDGQILAQEWSGFPTSGTLLDTSVNNTGSSAATTTSSNLTTGQTNEQIFSLIMLQSQTNTYTLGTGYTNLSTIASSFTSAAMESKAVAASGTSTNASFGMSNVGVAINQVTAALLTSTSASSLVNPAQYKRGGSMYQRSNIKPLITDY